jgi:hypothetical protein
MTNRAIREALETHLIRAGIRDVEHPTETAIGTGAGAVPNSTKRIRKSVSLSKGFRKRAISIFMEAGLNHEIRELIVDHATMLDQNYFRPREEQVLAEYLKAEPLLTIDPAARLARENQTLRIEKSSWEAMRKELDEIKALFNKD